MIGSLLQDIRYGFRMLIRTPGFSLVCVLTMALAIGANTAIFSVVNGVLLQPLPYRDADRIVVIWESNPRLNASRNVIGSANFVEWRARERADGNEQVGQHDGLWTGTRAVRFGRLIRPNRSD